MPNIYFCQPHAKNQGMLRAVLSVNGFAAAVIFARSRGVDGRAWATDISEVKPLLAADSGKPVDRGTCSEFA